MKIRDMMHKFNKKLFSKDTLVALKESIRSYTHSCTKNAGNKLLELAELTKKKIDSLPDDISSQHDSVTEKSYYSDEPILSRKDDLFNRANFALRIVETIVARKDSSSIVLGVYGAWGDGKTSVLEMMSEALQDHEHVVTIKFNPWLFQSEELLLNAFFPL